MIFLVVVAVQQAKEIAVVQVVAAEAVVAVQVMDRVPTARGAAGHGAISWQDVERA